jgi:hypothetical protein
MIVAHALARYARKSRRVFAARDKTVGASEMGHCKRQVHFAKTGAVCNADFVENWGAMARGAVFERNFWLPALNSAYGRQLKLAGVMQQTLTKGFLSATPDGVLVNLAGNELAPLGVEELGGDNSLVVECKTIHCYPNSTWPAAPKIPHVFQVQVQLGMIHACTEYRPEYALVSYTNASDWADTREFPVKRDPKIFAVALERARQVMTATSAADLPPEGLLAGGLECGWCPYSQACRRIQTGKTGAGNVEIAESKTGEHDGKVKTGEHDEDSKADARQHQRAASTGRQHQRAESSKRQHGGH